MHQSSFKFSFASESYWYLESFVSRAKVLDHFLSDIGRLVTYRPSYLPKNIGIHTPEIFRILFVCFAYSWRLSDQHRIGVVFPANTVFSTSLRYNYGFYTGAMGPSSKCSFWAHHHFVPPDDIKGALTHFLATRLGFLITYYTDLCRCFCVYHLHLHPSTSDDSSEFFVTNPHNFFLDSVLRWLNLDDILGQFIYFFSLIELGLISK